MIKIPDTSYEAKVQADGSVKVGCQTVPFKLLEEIYNAATKVKG